MFFFSTYEYECSFQFFFSHFLIFSRALLDLFFILTNGLKIYVFCDLLFSPFNDISSTSFHGRPADLLFTYCSVAWRYSDLFQLILVGGQLGSCQYFSITEKAAVNNLVHGSLCLCLVLLWD